jgi:hypothetical protein
MNSKAILFVAVSLLFVLVTPSEAQGTCEIDLSDTVALLVRAQAAASTGNSDEALDAMADASVALDEFQAVCEGGGEQTVPVELSEEFTLDAQLGTIEFAYPEGWETRIVEDGIVAISADPEILEFDFAGSEPPSMEEGQQLLLVLVADEDFFGPSGTEEVDPVDMLTMFVDNLASQFGEPSEVTAVTLDDRPAAELVLTGDTFELQIVLIEVARSVRGQTFALVYGLAAPGEVEGIADVARAVAESTELRGN